MGSCGADFQRLAAQLGDFGCAGQNAVVNLHNPFALDHWTMLVIELAMIVGAVLALLHALRQRREGNPTTLGIWLASLVYLVFVEPPLYFPESFGLQDQVGLIFVHNEFTVQFMWGRLPLYIVSIYPVLAVLTYELVRATGVMERRGRFASAVTVGFVFHCVYEVFDMVGPQLSWWIWNPTAPTNEPFLAAVPVSSMVNLALAGPVVLAFLAMWLVGGRPDAPNLSTRSLVGWSALAGVLMPLGLVIGGMPATVFSLGEVTNHTAQGIAYFTMLAIAGVVAISALLDAYRHRAGSVDAPTRRYLTAHASIYLGALVIAWIAALPEYVAARDGITSSGTPIGSLPYAAACLAFSLGFLWLALARRPGVVSEDAGAVAVSV